MVMLIILVITIIPVSPYTYLYRRSTLMKSCEPTEHTHVIGLVGLETSTHLISMHLIRAWFSGVDKAKVSRVLAHHSAAINNKQSNHKNSPFNTSCMIFGCLVIF